jgi:hypothetical protein
LEKVRLHFEDTSTANATINATKFPTRTETATADPSPSHLNTGAIVGGAVGGSLVLILILLLVLAKYIFARQRHQGPPPHTDKHPNPVPIVEIDSHALRYELQSALHELGSGVGSRIQKEEYYKSSGTQMDYGMERASSLDQVSP